MNFFVSVLSIIMVASLSACSFTSAVHPGFSYTGDNGPGFWAELSDANAACLEDTRQSPIDIGDSVEDGSLGALDLELHDTEIHLINNGHTIELEYHEGSTLVLGGRAYDLLQLHFHTFSEHVINEKRSDMEMHAVFKDTETGNLAVIGVLFNVGAESDFLAALEGRLPGKSGEIVEVDRMINLADGLTDTTAYYTYEGSLTTPPCSPIVTWVVLKESTTLSRSQFNEFRKIMGNNFRPLQNIFRREIRTTL